MSLKNILATNPNPAPEKEMVHDPETGNVIIPDHLSRETTGIYNTTYGVDAGKNTLTGTKNTAVGYASMLKNEVGHYNTCVGWESGKNAVSLVYNCNFGGRASQYNTGGHYGCNYGYQAGGNATNNHGMCAFGMQALYYASGGYYNIGVGQNAGNVNLSSAGGNGYRDCIFIGYNSGNPSSSTSTYRFGDYNIFIGHRAQGKDSGNRHDNQIVIGKEAKGEGDNTVVLGNASCVSWQSTERSGSGTLPCNLGTTTNKFGHVFCNNITAVLPTSTTGLSVGQMWNSSGTVKIVN